MHCARRARFGAAGNVVRIVDAAAIAPVAPRVALASVPVVILKINWRCATPERGLADVTLTGDH